MSADAGFQTCDDKETNMTSDHCGDTGSMTDNSPSNDAPVAEIVHEVLAEMNRRSTSAVLEGRFGANTARLHGRYRHRQHMIEDAADAITALLWDTRMWTIEGEAKA